MQLPSSENQGENGKSSAELREEVEQLSDIASNIAIDSEIQAKIQNLLAQIKTSLQQQQLSIKMQRELAKLLSLISTLDYGNPQQIDILDLAISTLLENKEDTIQNHPDSSLPNKGFDKTSRNLVFIKEARRQIAIQSQEYPNPLSAIIKGTGGAHNRLLSGLSWFAFLFVIVPVLVTLLIFFHGKNSNASKMNATKDNFIKRLEIQLENTKKRLETKDEISNAFRGKLNQVHDELDKLKPLSDSQKELKGLVDDSEQNIQEKDDNLITTLQSNIKKELDSAKNKEIVLIKSSSNDTVSDTESVNNTSQENISSIIKDDLKSISEKERKALEKEIQEEVKKIPAVQLEEIKKQIIFDKTFFESPVFRIAIAVSMGGLGSAISVIVRAKKFIEQGKEGKSDLFFTGFFRPIVGMSFAIFAVALIESGIFSSIFTTAKEEERKVYLYMAIAFIVGFSERLVEDVVMKTENTLMGVSSRSEK